MKNPPLFILALALLAATAKIYCAWTTIGTADIPFFAQFGQIIAERGVIAVYREVSIYNHPPGLTAYLGAIWEWADGHGRVIARFVRVPGVVADFLLVLLLLWVRKRTGKPAWWALGLFAVSPVSFMVSGYHGNFDPFIVLGIALTAAACVLGRPVWAGILLGLTCQVKVIPVLIAPVFFFFWLHRRQSLRFAASAGVTTLLGWLIPLCVVPQLFLKQVLGQSSIWGWWGLTYLLRASGEPAFFGASPPYNATQMAVINASKLIIIGAILALAWLRRKEPPEALFPTLALAFLVFLVFAPGFGVQYLLWLAPFLLLHSERWYTVVTVATSIGLFVFYNTISGGMPWDRAFLIQPSIDKWAPWLLLPWAVLIFCLAGVAMALFAPPRPEQKNPVTAAA